MQSASEAVIDRRNSEWSEPSIAYRVEESSDFRAQVQLEERDQRQEQIRRQPVCPFAIQVETSVRKPRFREEGVRCKHVVRTSIE